MITTNAGIEEVTRLEILERIGMKVVPCIEPEHVTVKPWGCLGRVLIYRPSHSLSDGVQATAASGTGKLVEPQLEELLLQLRSVHDVIWLHKVLPLPTTDDPALALYEALRMASLDDGGPVPPLCGGLRSFRVSCVREGEHPFTSLDIEREVGGALHELYGARADMKRFALRVRADVAVSHLLLGTAINREPLSKRHKLVFTRSVTLKPNVAYALLALGRCTKGARLLDPCCGCGTIPLEVRCVS